MEHLYGQQTKLAEENFRLTGKKTSPHMIFAMTEVKKAAALTYQKLIPEKKELYSAMERACDCILSCRTAYEQGTKTEELWINGHSFSDTFVTEAWQGGAGTSAHMNLNEVLASLTAMELCKLHGTDQAGEAEQVHPLDDVNRGQSTNDVYPTALRIAAIRELRKLSGECAALQETLQEKENEFADAAKLGRTELMDAIPITLGAEFGAYAQALARDRWRLYKVEERLRQTNLGGTAVGGGDNVSHRYQALVTEYLRDVTGMGLARAEYPMDLTQNQDVFVEVSGLLKALSVNLLKMANDIRLMNSGPRGGLGEITLAKVQAGSTIMPGKVNPVMAEMAMQVSMKVIAGDTAVTLAAAHGEFELNAFLPLIADSLLENLELLTAAVRLFREKCIKTVKANRKRCRELLEASCAFATEYTPQLGYERVSAIIEACRGEPGAVRRRLTEELEKNDET